MSEGIPAVVRRNNSIHLWLWGDVQWHSNLLSLLTSGLFLFAVCILVPAHFVTKRPLGMLSEMQRFAMKATG
jgi:hypothetical protein